MPNFVSPALYIDLARLSPPQVVEEIQYEALLKIYQAEVLGKLPILEEAIKLEQSPTNVILEAEAYGEMLVRARINAAARAVMLPFAVGTDLDNLAAFYNEERQAIVENPRAYPEFKEDWESDERFRRKVQLSPEAFTTTGSAGAYTYHALKAAPTLQDATAFATDRNGSVRITLMNSGSDPVPTQAQIDAVKARLSQRMIKPLTVVQTIVPPNVNRVKMSAEVVLYPGPDQSLVVADITKALTAVKTNINRLGRDLTRNSLIAAMSQDGVYNVKLNSPTTDVIVGDDACVVLTPDSGITIATYRGE